MQGDKNDFGHTTISNLKGSDDWLWVHVIVVILFFPLGIYFMRHFSVGLNLTKDTFDDAAPQEDDGAAAAGPEEEDTKESYAAKTLMVSGVPPVYCTKEVRPTF